jgi:epoxyqueuosine reductase
MNAKNITKTIDEKMKQEGWQAKIVSIEHVRDLQREIQGHHQNGHLDQELYGGYLDRFDFDIPENFSEAKSLIIVSAPQPHVRVAFAWQGQILHGIIPSTYSLATDHQIKNRLEGLLKPQGYHLEQKRLPEKLCLHRLAVFVSDLLCVADNWGEVKTLKTCDGCTACMDACPTGAIVSDRFLIHAERCITFHNERQGEFAKWLDPSWHNCLVGCLYCQNACPMNQKLRNWIEDGSKFSEEETADTVNGVSEDKIAEESVTKLETLGMMEYLDVLGRNLKVLIERRIESRG